MAKGGRQTADNKSVTAIRAEEVLLLDEEGNDLGFVPTTRALALARERGLDLVQLDALSSPPRCQLLDAGARQAEIDRARRLARSAATPPKELRLRLQTGAADLETRRRSAATLLEAGHRVKIRVELDPGQRGNPAPARAMLDGLIKALAAAGSPESKPFSEKGAVAVVLVPR